MATNGGEWGGESSDSYEYESDDFQGFTGTAFGKSTTSDRPPLLAQASATKEWREDQTVLTSLRGSPDAGVWSCSVCTFSDNKVSQLRCEVCDSLAVGGDDGSTCGGAAPLPPSPLSVHASELPIVRAAPSAQAWECYVCTLRNVGANVECAACDTPRCPVASSSSANAVHSGRPVASSFATPRPFFEVITDRPVPRGSYTSSHSRTHTGAGGGSAAAASGRAASGTQAGGHNSEDAESDEDDLRSQDVSALVARHSKLVSNRKYLCNLCGVIVSTELMIRAHMHVEHRGEALQGPLRSRIRSKHMAPPVAATYDRHTLKRARPTTTRARPRTNNHPAGARASKASSQPTKRRRRSIDSQSSLSSSDESESGSTTSRSMTSSLADSELSDSDSGSSSDEADSRDGSESGRSKASWRSRPAGSDEEEASSSDSSAKLRSKRKRATRKRGDSEGSISHLGAVRPRGSPQSSPRERPRNLTEEEIASMRASRLQLLLERTDAITRQLQGMISAARQPAVPSTDAVEVSASLSVDAPAVGSTAGAASVLTQLSPVRGATLARTDRKALVAAPTASCIAAVPLAAPRAMTGATLHPYQLAGLEWLVQLHDSNLNGILADEMGLGKTLQVLSLLLLLAEQNKTSGPHLVVAPLSVVYSWMTDITKFAPTLLPHVHVHRGGGEERRVAFLDFMRPRKRGAGASSSSSSSSPPPLPTVVITTYEIALRDADLLKKTEWQYMVVDEGHRLKNIHCKLGAALRRLRCAHRLLLTGTPLQNNLNELWSLLNFCLPTLFNSGENFMEWFAAPFANTVTVASATMRQQTLQPAALALSPEEEAAILSRLHSVLRPFLLRRTKREVLGELPSKTEVVLLCPMSALQVAMYERTRLGLRQYIDPTSGRVQRHVSMTNIVLRLRQICNHPYLLAEEWTVDANLVRSCGKFEVLHRLLPKLIAAGHRILLFSQTTSMLDLIEDMLDMLALTFARLDGSTKQAERDELLRDFNAPACTIPLLLLSTRAGGVGINLQSADTVILFDSDWNPQQDLQAQARAHRMGQSKPVQVIRLVSRGPHVPVEAARSPPATATAGSATAAAAVKGTGRSPLGRKPAKPSQGVVPTASIRFSRSVEELMFIRALHKLRTERTVLGDGQFHAAVGHTSTSSLGIGSGGGPKSKTVIHDLLVTIMKSAEGSITHDGFVVETDATSPEGDGCDASGSASGSGSGSGSVSGSVRSSSSVVPSDESVLRRLGGDSSARGPFASIPNDSLNRVVARDAADLRSLQLWDGHLAAVLLLHAPGEGEGEGREWFYPDPTVEPVAATASHGVSSVGAEGAALCACAAHPMVYTRLSGCTDATLQMSHVPRATDLTAAAEAPKHMPPTVATNSRKSPRGANGGGAGSASSPPPPLASPGAAPTATPASSEHTCTDVVGTARLMQVPELPDDLRDFVSA